MMDQGAKNTLTQAAAYPIVAALLDPVLAFIPRAC